MALIFSLYVECRAPAEVAAFIAHFDGLRWTLADGTETTLEAGPYCLTMPAAPPGTVDRTCWVTPTAISTSGIRDERDAVRMTELGNRLCAHLRTAPAFEVARVGLEVDQRHEEAELVEHVRDGWSGLIFSDALYRRAGAPPASIPFRDGMWWYPYAGEWEHSATRHVPDLTVVGCLGCDQPIREHELVRVVDHGHVACCLWHPYHLWCVRDAPPATAAISACAHCDEPLPTPSLHGTLAWGATALHHLHRRSIAVDPPFAVCERADVYARKPPGVSRIAVVSRTIEPPSALHEFVHDACPTRDPWLLRLRAAPGDRELRTVYADHLEQHGELARADLVRALLVVPPPAQARARAELLEARLATVSRAWLRDVCR